MIVLSRIPLTLVLLVGAACELLLNRIGMHLVDSGDGHDWLFSIVDVGGLFSFYLTGILALVLFAWGAVVLIVDRELLTVDGRIAMMLASAVFLPLAGTGLVFRLPKIIAPSLNAAFGVTVVVALYAFARSRAPVRAKLGVLYLAAPLLLHCYWLMTQQLTSLAPTGQRADLPAKLLLAGEHLVVIGAFASFLFFVPFPRLAALVRPVPGVIAALVTGAFTAFVTHQHALATSAAYYGLSLNLPGAQEGGLRFAIHIAALFFFTLAVATLIFDSPRGRATASGLLFVAISGYHLQLPYQLLLTMVGLLQLMRAGIDQIAPDAPELPTAPTAEQWRAYLDRLQQAFGGGEAMLLRSEERLIARLRGRLADAAGEMPVSYTVRLQIERGAIPSLEVDIGVPPKDEPPATLVRRHRRRGHRVSDGRGPRVKGFDSQFVLRDESDRLAEVLAPLAEGLRCSFHGWAGIWPAEGVQYLTRPLADGWPLPVAQISVDPETAPLADVQQLVELLAAIARKLDVRG